jgi:hypothetical protein
MCARQVSQKNDIFCGLCKKEKNVSYKVSFEHQILSFSTHDKKKMVFRELLSERVECQDLHVNFFKKIKLYLNQI